MEFSDFVQILYPFCSEGLEESEFVVTITGNAMEEPYDKYNPLDELGPDYRRRIFNGEKPLPQKRIAAILSHLDKGPLLETNPRIRRKLTRRILFLLKESVTPYRPGRSVPRNPSPRKAKFRFNKKSNC